MADRGHVFRRAFSWLPAQFASQSDAPVGRRASSAPPSTCRPKPIAAFVDGELRMTAHLRAAHHLSLCPQCAAEVEAQRQARAALRDSCPIVIPSALLGMLSQIPHAGSAGADADAGSRSAGELADGAPRSRRKRR